MRIITGSARGITLETLDGESTRPTGDRVKEALFSMIQFEIEGRSVLDLFAGSGQLGLEALSRGAKSCTFIDQTRDASDIVLANAKKTKLFDKCRISTTDYKAFLRGAAGRESYDIIFLDPPYSSGFVTDALRSISDGKLLATGGKIICETDNGVLPQRRKKGKQTDQPELMQEQVFACDEELQKKFNIVKTSLYGRVRITLLEEADIINE